MNDYLSMYGGGASYAISDQALGLGVAGLVITAVLIACCIVAYFLAIGSLVKAARAKNTEMGNGRLWFIGIFTTPLILALIVIALPDRGQH